MNPPLISMVVVLYNMRREAKRTLHSLSAAYQEGCSPDDYEVHVVENGSRDPVDEAFVTSFGSNFHYHRLDNPPPSPAHALNYGIARSRGKYIGLIIDGAHIVTPRVLAYARTLAAAVPCPIMTVRRFFLGPGQQPDTTQRGYTQEVEDRLLHGIAWPTEPYRLFEIATFMGKRRPGWFGRFWESNCLIVPRFVLDEIGGCDERFELPGGGFVNLDLYSRCAEYPGAQVFVLLGEGSFHQVHGGTTTNIAPDEAEALIETYRQDYERVRGRPYEIPLVEMAFFGSLHPRSFLV
jgi:glycosyltransferase involved in cell wall biosynthesis